LNFSSKNIIIYCKIIILFFRKVINLKKLLKVFIVILLALISLQTVKAQTLMKLRSTLSSGGSSKAFTYEDQQYYLQQSIGQSSVTGLSQNNNYLLRQGFIQPLKGSINSIPSGNLPATIFPNPFSANIIVSFTEDIQDILYVTLYDLNGKIVYLKKHEPATELNLDVSSLVPAIYFIRVNTATKWFYSKMIKL
jgi:hypothetical protein